MRCVVVLALLVGCGRIGFDATATSGDDGGPGDDAPLPVGRWRSVEVADSHGCAITVTGELWCFGTGAEGQLGINASPELSPPARVGTETDWSEVTIELQHSCGRRADGSLWCWGNNVYGELGVGIIGQAFESPERVSPPTLWKRVRAGDWHTCAIRDDDSLWCWGLNNVGQLGIASQVDQVRPIKAGVALWKAIALGSQHTCGIQIDGSLWCWGENFEGRTGLGTMSGQTTSPTLVSAGPWRDLDIGFSHTCAIAMTDALWCWGHNSQGQLGDGSETDRSTPVMVLGGVARVATGLYHTCAATTAGALQCWGDGARGPIAQHEVDKLTSPTLVAAPAITQLTAGGSSTCLVDDAAHLFCTGASSYGQTGGVPGEVHAPERADTRTDWREVSAQGEHACGTMTDGSVYCWGLGGDGELGDGARVDRQAPVVVPGVTADDIEIGDGATLGMRAQDPTLWGYDMRMGNVHAPMTEAQALDVALGVGHRCWVGINASLRCFGDNSRGQIGDGTTTPIAGGTFLHTGSFIDVAAWNKVTCATDGTSRRLMCWGDGPLTGTNTTGNVLVPTNVVGIPSSVSAVELGGDFGCALVGPGTLWCWGKNTYGQLGIGSTTAVTGANQVGTRTDWRIVDAGDLHACAIAADRTLWCWGHGDQGQLGQGTLFGARTTPVQVGTAGEWQDVACGLHFTCAIKTDGTRWCFGVNAVGQLGNDRAWVTDFTVVP